MTNEDVLPIIKKSALMSLAQWSQAHAKELERTQSDSQSLAQSPASQKKSSGQSGGRSGTSPIDENHPIKGEQL